MNKIVKVIDKIKKSVCTPKAFTSIIPIKAPKAAPKSHQVLTLEMACNEFSCSFCCSIATNGENVTTIVLNKKATMIPIIGKPTTINSKANITHTTPTENNVLGRIFMESTPLRIENNKVNSFLRNK